MLPVAARFYHAPIGRSILYRMCRCSPQSMRHSSLYTGRCTVFCYFKNVCAARSLYQPKHLQLPTLRLHNSWHAIIVRCLGTWTTADFESFGVKTAIWPDCQQAPKTLITVTLAAPITFVIVTPTGQQSPVHCPDHHPSIAKPGPWFPLMTAWRVSRTTRRPSIGPGGWM
jgi:hypothetical protein